MALPHPKSRKRNYWKRHISNYRSVVRRFLKRTINITDYRNGEDKVNPAKYGTFGGFNHDWFVNLFVCWLPGRRRVFAEKNLSRNNDREGYHNHHCKC
jgi:hypothetical protein